MATLSSKLSIYLRSSGISLLAKVVANGSGFASVWLLNRILVKGAYGNYELAFTIVALSVLVGSGGLNHAVMYRLSRVDAAPEELDGHDFAGAALGWSLLLSCAVVLVLTFGAPYVETLGGNENLGFWISLLAFLIPIKVAKAVYNSWYKARQRIPEAITMGAMLPALGKAGFLGSVWLVWPTPAGVVVAVLLSELIPLLIWYARTPINPLHLGGQFSSWDVWYSLKLALTKGLSKTLKRADVLMVGFLAAAEATAEYVVAAKIALLLVVAHQMLNGILRPRIGRFLGQKRPEAIQREYDQSRTVALLFALSGMAFFAILGKPILEIFGEYSSAYPVLMILAASHVVKVSFGMCGGYLNIAGYAGWTLTTTLSLLLANISVNYLLIPAFGALGAAYATLFSFSMVNILVAYVVRKLDGLKIYSFELSYVSVGVVTLVSLKVSNLVGPRTTFVVLVLIIIATLYVKSKRLIPMAKKVLEISLEERTPS